MENFPPAFAHAPAASQRHLRTVMALLRTLLVFTLSAVWVQTSLAQDTKPKLKPKIYIAPSIEEKPGQPFQPGQERGFVPSEEIRTANKTKPLVMPDTPEVRAAMARGVELCEQDGRLTKEFRENLQGISAQLPRAAPRLRMRRHTAYTMKLNEHGQHFDAFIIKNPLHQWTDLHLVLSFSGAEGKIPREFNICTLNDDRRFGYHTFWVQKNAQFQECALPKDNETWFLAIGNGEVLDSQEYAIWFYCDDDQPIDLTVMMVASPKHTSPNILSSYDTARAMNLHPLQPDGRPAFQHYKFPALSTRYAPDGSTFVKMNQASLWVGQQGEERDLDLKAELPESANTVLFSPTGESLFLGCRADASIHQLNAKTWEITGQWGAKVDGLLNALAISPAGDLLAASYLPGEGAPTQEKSIVLWDIAKKTRQASFSLENWTCDALAFAPDGKSLVAACGEIVKETNIVLETRGKLLVLSVPKLEPTQQVDEPRWTDSLAMDPAGRYLACGSSLRDGRFRSWPKLEHLAFLPAAYGVTDLAFAPRGKYLAVAGKDREIFLFDPQRKMYTSCLSVRDAMPVSMSIASSGDAISVGLQPTMKNKTLSTKSPWWVCPLPEPGAMPSQPSIQDGAGIRLMPIPAGNFIMGDDKGLGKNERPQHLVKMAQPFYLGQTEVTVGQFRQFVTETGYVTEAERSAKGGSRYIPETYSEATKGLVWDKKYTWKSPGFEQTDLHPVVQVSWADAVAFCDWLSKKEGSRYRLPTEEEWEYACHGGTPGGFFQGNLLYNWLVANTAEVAYKEKHPIWEKGMAWDDGYAYTAPVASYMPNAWGLYDATGNVWEWCQDWYAEDAYAQASRNHGKGPAQGTERTARGGCFSEGAMHSNVLRREPFDPAQPTDTVGFRVLREMSGMPGQQPAPQAEPGNSPDSLAEANKMRQLQAPADAAVEYGKLIALAEKQATPNLEQICTLRRLQAESLRAAGQFEAAVLAYKECLRVSEASITKETLRAPNDVAELANTYFVMGQASHALAGLDRIKELRIQRLGANHPAVADVCYAQGLILHHDCFAKQDPRPVACLAEAVRIRREALPPGDPALVEALILLGREELSQSSFNEAESHLQQAHDLMLQAREKNVSLITQVKCDLARVWGRLGESEFSRTAWMEVLAFANANEPADTATQAYLERRLGEFLEDVPGMQPMVLGFYTQGLKHAELLHGQRHPLVANFLLNLASIHYKVGQFEEADKFAQQALQMAQQIFGKNHLVTTLNLYLCGQIELKQKHYPQAEAYFRRMTELYDLHRQAGPIHTPTHLAYLRLAELYEQTKQPDQVLQAYDRAMVELEEVMRHSLLTSTRTRQAGFMTLVQRDLGAALGIALLRPQDQALVDHSAGWSLNLKGRMFDLLAQREHFLTTATEPEIKTLVEQLRQVRKNMAEDATTRRVTPRKSELWREERVLTTQIAGLALRKSPSLPAVTLKSVRAGIPQDAVLIELRHVTIPQIVLTDQKFEKFIAWVIPPTGQGEVQFVELGTAGDIDLAVKKYRQQIAQAPSLIESQGESQAVLQLDNAGHKLEGLILRPLEKLAAKYPKWILSPDTSLWQVPWAALRTEDGKYLVEKHELEYRFSYCQLPGAAAQNKNKTGVILAAPELDSGTLPGAEEEARAVAPLLSKLTGSPATMLLGNEVTEDVLKQVQSPPYLMLSMHGFFEEADSRTISPLLLSGLLLKGATREPKAKQTRYEFENGVFTALEALSLNLQGTKLVVLSACNTGLGETQHGESLAGLCQSFHVAGAAGVLATLWEIPDRETPALVINFFQQLGTGESPAAALAQAQRTIIAQRTKSVQAAHPIYWAAFSLSNRLPEQKPE